MPSEATNKLQSTRQPSQPQLADSVVVGAAAEEAPPPSRHPLRRTLSERHSSVSDCLATIETNKKSRARKRNTAFDFKDTTALRERAFHSDARDLFARYNNASLRPKEPPPPPPPSPPSTPTATAPSSSTTIIPSAATNRKASFATDNQVQIKTLPTSSERRPLSASISDGVDTMLSPTGHTQQKQQQQQQQAQGKTQEEEEEVEEEEELEEEVEDISINTDADRKGLESHSDEKQQLPPHYHQRHSTTTTTTTKNRIFVASGAGAAGNVTDSTASTEPTSCENQRNCQQRSNNGVKANNNSISCQAITKGTTRSNNNNNNTVVAETATSSSSTNNREYQRSSSRSQDAPARVNPSTTSTKTTTSPTPNYNKSADNNNFSLFGKKPHSTNQQRTVVRVAPFINNNNSEVHRLKISHSDENYVAGAVGKSAAVKGSSNNYNKGNGYNYESDYLWAHNSGPSSPTLAGAHVDAATWSAQKKTSILINGDDCYSTMNISHDTAMPLYQSSVVVTDCTSATAAPFKGGGALQVSSSSNTVTINVGGSSRRTAEEELIYQHNQLNNFLSKQAVVAGGGRGRRVGAAIIPINGSNEAATNAQLQRSASSVSSTSSAASTSSSCTSRSSSNNYMDNNNKTKRGRTLIKLSYNPDEQTPSQQTPKALDESLNETVDEHDPKSNTTTAATTTTAAGKTPTEMAAMAATSPSLAAPHAQFFSHEAELVKILRNPVEAVRRNIVPHVCGKNGNMLAETERSKKMSQKSTPLVLQPLAEQLSKTDPEAAISINFLLAAQPSERNSFIAKLLEDPMLSQVAEGLEQDTIVRLIENSLNRLKASCGPLAKGHARNDNEDIMRLINSSLLKLREEREPPNSSSALITPTAAKDEDDHSNRGSISSATSFSSANNYEMFEFDTKSESDCYQSCSSEITSPGDEDGSGGRGGGGGGGGPSQEAAATRSKFYQMLVDATLAEIELSNGLEDEDADADAEEAEHHYESIRNNNGDPIYEEIGEVPPPLPLTAPPTNDAELEKKTARSMFEGASKYDILSYLVDAKERGLIREEVTFDYPLNCSNPIIVEEEASDTLSDLGRRKLKSEGRDNSLSRASRMSDSSEDNQSTLSSLSPPPPPVHSFLGGHSGLLHHKDNAADIERNDSGVGSETSKTSRSKYQHSLSTNANGTGSTGSTTSATAAGLLLHKHSPLHLCEDCDAAVETQITDTGVVLAPLVCRKCGKKRAERKEIITEIVETEQKYGRDLQIVLEEFCQPMLVAGLLTQEQLSAIFLNTEELLENNQTLAERMRDALDIALEQGDDDLLTVNIGRIFLDSTQMLHAFESYCVRQAGASLLLANLEKEKELLRIFLKVSQMENTVLRRMNLNSFLMVPVQRVTKYPLLLARLYKVTPAHLDGRDLLKQAQEKIELHLNHINQEAKDVPTKLWRRISSSSPNRRASCEIDMINIKLRKMAIDVLEWNHDEVRFVLEGKLLYTQPTDNNWKKARTIKLAPVNALLVTNGKPSANYKAEKAVSDKLSFSRHTGVREAALLVVKEKCGRYALTREPLYLDRCVVCSEADWDDYFEVQEISSKDTFIFKAEDGVRTKQWYTQLQYHAQGMGAWRKRRNALANIMINGMLARS